MKIIVFITLLSLSPIISAQTASGSTAATSSNGTTLATQSPPPTMDPSTAPCTCDDMAAISIPTEECTVTVDEYGEPVNFVGGCTCVVGPVYYWIVGLNQASYEYFVTCQEGTTTTTTTTTAPITDPSDYPGGPIYPGDEYDDDEGSGDEPIFYEGPCNVTALEGSKRNISKIFFYVASIWVIIWTLITIIVNLVCRENGHHRSIGILEEITIIVMFVFLGFFIMDPLDSEKFCKITGIILHATLILLMSFFLFEAIFARSFVKGSSEKNGSIPPFLNYILPFLLPIIPVVVSYIKLKDFYGATGVHCFVIIYSDMLWAFAMPPWILFMVGIIIGQLAFLACEQALPNVDKGRLYWGIKMCKALPILSSWILTSYFLAMFSLDMQKFWVMIVYLISCIFLGPLIFICHTYCYQKTATKLWNSTKMGFYRPCPEKPKRPPTPYEDKPYPPQQQGPGNNPGNPYNNPSNVNPYTGQPQNAGLPPRPVQPNQSPIAPVDSGPTKSMDLYDWATNRNPHDVNASINVLFRRR